MKKEKKVSVKKNYIYNMLYQIFTMIVPIITTPYISQILLPEGVGKYSYTYSIVSFFILFAQLGFGYYAQREIAKYQGNKYRQTVLFYEIMIVKGISVSLSLIVYIIMCISGTFGEYIELMWWWILLILAQEADISFLFQGNEDFIKVVFRNLFIKILGIVMIFVLIKSPKDVWIYILSVSLSNFLGAISTWIYLPNFLCKVDRNDIHPMQHVKPAVQLFIPTIASVIYSYLDKILIGVLIDGTYVDSDGIIKKYSDLENGFYEQSEKIVKVGMSIITALGAVMLPRNSKEFATGNKEKLKSNIYTAISFTFIIGCPLMLGLISIAPNLIPWFLGNGYEKCILYMRLFCPLVILIGLDNVFGIQYLLTTDRDKKYTIAIVTGTIVNIILNILLIPYYEGKGAILASVLAESIIVGIMYFFIRKELSVKTIFLNIKNYLISSIFMFAVLIIVQKKLIPSIINTIILIVLGASIYSIILILLKDKLLMNFINNLLSRIKLKNMK